MDRRITLGSLFDGIGGFPLSGSMCGVKPVWASEIEPFPIAVTMNRFPNMKHLGSVTDIKGDQIEPVDIITFGSPCQDLSVAGKQAGIHDGARSNLFFEAVRIIKEMREHDRANGRTGFDVRPRFAVWENVPGAFSSGKGKDFQAVLQTLCEVSDPDVSIPMPEKGKWDKAGCIVGDGYSVAWRVYDAQYWGVPQRRKRIYLVADFASECAGEILFESESVSGYPETSREAREGTAPDAEGSACGSCYAFHLQQDPVGGSISPCIGGQHQATVGVFMGGQGSKARTIGYSEQSTPTLKSVMSGSNTVPDVVYQTVAIEGNGQRESHRGDGYSESDQMYTLNTVEKHAVCYGIGSYASNAMKSDNPHSGIYEAKTSRTLDLNGGNPACNQGGMVVAIDCRNMVANNEVSATIQSKNQGGHSLNYINPIIYESREDKMTIYENFGFGKWREGFGTVRASGGDAAGGSEMLCVGRTWERRGGVTPTLTGDHENRITDYTAVAVYPRTTGALCANSHPGSYTGQDAFNDMLPVIPGKPPRKYIVRRLTTLECCRLQGYLDGWTENISFDALSQDQVDQLEQIRKTWAEANGKKYKPCKNIDALKKWFEGLQTDSAEYKAYGNSLAIPCSYDVISRVAREIRRTNNERGQSTC